MKTSQYFLIAWLLVLPVLGQCQPIGRESFEANAEPVPRPKAQPASRPVDQAAPKAKAQGTNEDSVNGEGGNGSNGGNGGNGSNGKNNNNNSSNGNNGTNGGKKGVGPQGQQDTTSNPSSSTTTATILSTTTLSMFTPTPTTVTNTIEVTSSIPSASAAAATTQAPSSTFDVTSLLSSMSSSLSSETASVAPGAAATGATTPAPSAIGITSSTTSLGLPAESTSVGSTQSNHSSGHRNLVISLSVILGLLAIGLIAGALYLLHLYLCGRRPFSRRGATPIHEDEIASWRVSGTTEGGKAASIIEKEPLPTPMLPAPPLPLTATVPETPEYSRNMHHSGWTWSIRSSGAPISPRPGFISGLSMPDPDSPSFIARAPNSRTGLTDATVPGQDPFIQPAKRQSSRLSKAAPGHGRSKSRRSSMSAKSFVSFQSGPPPLSSGGYLETPAESKVPATWFDPEDEAMWRSQRDSTHTSNSGTPEPASFNGTTPLSPRPHGQTRPETGGTGRTIA